MIFQARSSPQWGRQRAICTNNKVTYRTYALCGVLCCTVLYCTVLYCTVLPWLLHSHSCSRSLFPHHSYSFLTTHSYSFFTSFSLLHLLYSSYHSHFHSLTFLLFSLHYSYLSSTLTPSYSHSYSFFTTHSYISFSFTLTLTPFILYPHTYSNFKSLSTLNPLLSLTLTPTLTPTLSSSLTPTLSSPLCIGISGFYRGIEANVMRAMVLNGTKMSCYDQIKVTTHNTWHITCPILILSPSSLSLIHTLSLSRTLYTHSIHVLIHTSSHTLPLTPSPLSLTHSHSHSQTHYTGHDSEESSHPCRSPHTVLRCFRCRLLHGLHCSALWYGKYAT